MKKVKAIRNLFGEEMNLNNMEIIHIGENWCTAKVNGFGFIKTYGPWDGYTVEIEEENA